MLDSDNPSLDAVLDAIPDDPEPAPSGDPAVEAASASSPSPAAPATATDLILEEVLEVYRSGSYSPSDLFVIIQGAVQAYHEFVPDSHPLITDLYFSARRKIQVIIVNKGVPTVVTPTDELLVNLMRSDHPTADQAIIESVLWAAYQEVRG